MAIDVDDADDGTRQGKMSRMLHRPRSCVALPSLTFDGEGHIFAHFAYLLKIGHRGNELETLRGTRLKVEDFVYYLSATGTGNNQHPS